jgi:hypothetical protein
MKRAAARGLLAALALLPGAAAAWRQESGTQASECDSLAGIPLSLNVDYNTQIQPIWDQRCANCHVDHAGLPSADLDLMAPKSWYFLYEQPSSQDKSLIRVLPGRPALSLLFTKVNCESVDVGVRMPRQRPPIPLAEQALIHDWILAGAPIAVTDPNDALFRDTFEPR